MYQYFYMLDQVVVLIKVLYSRVHNNIIAHKLLRKGTTIFLCLVNLVQVRCSRGRNTLAQKMLKEKEVSSFAEIAELENIDKTYIAKVFKLNYVAPDIIEAILKGNQPPRLNLRDFIQKTIPDLWEEQRGVFGF